MPQSLLLQDDREFLQLLNSLGAATIPELCSAAEVTATAIRQRLARLQDLQLISRSTVRAPRGRPHHKYELTDAGRHALGDNYAELAILLWEVLQQIEDVKIRDGVKHQLRREFAGRLQQFGTANSLDERMQELCHRLSDRGFRAEVGCDGDGRPVLREHHCPYFELAAKDAGICDIEIQAFEDVLGVPLEFVQRCRDGANCCEFRPVTLGGLSGEDVAGGSSP